MDHAKELNNPVPEEPVIFLKPDTALLKNNRSFYLPDFSDEIHYEGELVLKIVKNGKNIQEKFARQYYDQITVGIDFTARDIQKKCKQKGLPWELAKSFDNSAAVGEFIDISQFKNLNELKFWLTKNGNIVQTGFVKDMIFNFNQLLSFISQYITLKMGDLIYTGTPAGVGKIEIGDVLEGFIAKQKVLYITVK